jgi:(1->4)-alpha-D-glucan 1-alpha-D-glucosylmutase
MFVTMRALQLRRAKQALFQSGAYDGLPVQGTRAAHVIAFARSHEGSAVVAVTGRHFARLAGAADPLGAVWEDTKVVLPPALAGRRWRDALTDRTLGADSGALPLGEVLAALPVALLVG